MPLDRNTLVGKMIDRYQIENPLRNPEGKFGVTYKATDTKIGTDVAIKILKASTNDDSWKAEAKKAARVKNCPYVMRPIDFGESDIEIEGVPTRVRYIVSEFVNDNAMTLKHFLDQVPNMSGELVLDICRQICIAIKAMQDAGIGHNDLHESNIMVVPPPSFNPTGQHLIKVVDFGLAASLRNRSTPDIISLARIMRHLWELNQSYDGEKIGHDKKFIQSIPSLIAQIEDNNPERKLSDPVKIIERMQSMKQQTFGVPDFEANSMTDPFEFLNVEEIPEDSDLLSDLFSDSLPWYKDATSFGTLLISGHRGCGKSMVLKNMRLKTKLKSEKGRAEVKSDQFVGFYLHCHHNFYLPFAGKNIKKNERYPNMILHHFNLLFTYEVVDSLIELRPAIGLRLDENAQLSLFNFVNSFFEKQSVVVEGADTLEHLRSLISREIRIIERRIVTGENARNLTGAQYLRDFCDLLAQNIEFFDKKRVYFLLDDYSDTRGVTKEIQTSINRVIGYRNERFCFKITTERYAFIPYDIDKQNLVQDREFRYIDLGQRYLSYPFESEEEEFVRSILDKRLKRAGVQRNVRDLFGKYDPPAENIGASLARAETRSITLYAGFNTIYSLCSGDISTLLELCRDIYRQAKAKKKFPDASGSIDFKLQDDIIRNFSRDRIAMVREIQEYGDHLYLIVNAMGEIAKKYLTEYGEVGNQKGRFQEKIRIEVSGAKVLKADLVDLYQGMIKHGIFTDAGTGYPWGTSINDLRLILRRIYTPAFGISYRNRECVRMSPDSFEMFLTQPEVYSRKGTKFLDELDQPKLEFER